ncbi:MAG: 4Fe-4S binding protein [Candidatus Aminicenantes bacterium]
MLAHYGYKDGSGDYFITIDTDKCDGCRKCVEACPHGVLEVGEDENDPFREEPVAKVTEAERKKIKYTCAPCKPMKERKPLPCVQACAPQAIVHSW